MPAPRHLYSSGFQGFGSALVHQPHWDLTPGGAAQVYGRGPQAKDYQFRAFGCWYPRPKPQQGPYPLVAHAWDGATPIQVTSHPLEQPADPSHAPPKGARALT